MVDYSVLMSVYALEKADHFRTAVRSMLEQTVPPADFVLVCDGPLGAELDEAVEELQQEHPELYQIIRLPENRGTGYALQQGLPHCRCEIVAKMDSDDIAVKHRMEWQLAVLQARPDISVVGGQIAEFTAAPEQVTGYRIVPLENGEIRKTAAFRNPMNHVTTVFRRQAALESGGYRDAPGFEDYDLWARMLHDGKQMMNLEETLCLVRVNRDTYRRRGGQAYFRQTVAMQKTLLRCGLLNRRQYLRNLAVRWIGTVLLPPNLRGQFFRILMRKKTLR